MINDIINERTDDFIYDTQFVKMFFQCTCFYAACVFSFFLKKIRKCLFVIFNRNREKNVRHFQPSILIRFEA